MKCSHCGVENADDSVFCISCGLQTSLSATETAALEVAPSEETPVPSAALLDADTADMDAAPQHEDALLVAMRGALAGDYEINRELGRGGMAIVFEGVETELRRRVAVKVLPPEMATQDTAERFKREARMAASLDHPNIIPVYRVGQADGIQYMAMKFVDGRGLDEIVKDQGALPVPIVVRIIADSARALAFAHDNGVIHRDIKGANILIEKDGRVLVTDFGIARAVGDHTMTATGMVMGTPSYMSPEQCGGVKLNHQSDQYSLGVLAFQLLTGSLPFEAETFVGLVQHHYMTPPPDIKRVREDVPDELLAVVYRALAKRPEERFPNTKQMVAALDAVPLGAEERTEADHTLQELVAGGRVSRVEIDDLPPLVTPMETALAATRQEKSRLPVVVGTAAAVVAVASVGVAWQLGLFTPDVPPPNPIPPPDAGVLLAFDGLPDGAQVYVGDERFQRGQGMVQPESTYTYQIIANGYQTKRGTILVGTHDTTLFVRDSLQPAVTSAPRQTRPPVNVQPTTTGQLLVRVSPSFATIRLDGEEIDNSVTIEVSAGEHTLNIAATGYQTVDRTIDVPVDDILRIPITLTESGGHP
jgi:tRNA A-37 threonylcarbamoyl transferase component Bud32